MKKSSIWIIVGAVILGLLVLKGVSEAVSYCKDYYPQGRTYFGEVKTYGECISEDVPTGIMKGLGFVPFSFPAFACIIIGLIMSKKEKSPKPNDTEQNKHE